MIKDLNGKWWKVGSKLAAAATPPMWEQQHVLDFHPSDLGSSVYTAEQVSDWEDLMAYPQAVHCL